MVLANYTVGFQIKYISRIKVLVWPEMIMAILVTRWMGEWMDELDWIFMVIQIQES